MAAGENLHDFGLARCEGEAIGEQRHAGYDGERACGVIGRFVRMGRIRRAALGHARRVVVARKAEKVLVGHVVGAAALRMEAGIGNGEHAVSRRERHDDARVVYRGVGKLAPESQTQDGGQAVGPDDGGKHQVAREFAGVGNAASHGERDGADNGEERVGGDDLCVGTGTGEHTKRHDKRGGDGDKQALCEGCGGDVVVAGDSARDCDDEAGGNRPQDLGVHQAVKNGCGCDANDKRRERDAEKGRAHHREECLGMRAVRREFGVYLRGCCLDLLQGKRGERADGQHGTVEQEGQGRGQCRHTEVERGCCCYPQAAREREMHKALAKKDCRPVCAKGSEGQAREERTHKAECVDHGRRDIGPQCDEGDVARNAHEVEGKEEGTAMPCGV